MSFKHLVQHSVGRRSFLQGLSAALFGALTSRGLFGGPRVADAQSGYPIKQFLPLIYPSPQFTSHVYAVTDVPVPSYPTGADNHHAGVERLLGLLGSQGVKFYRHTATDTLSGPDGLIASSDVVLIKVNAQWKYRGATNSDVVRGVIQRILDHPAGFTGEVVIFENGQGRGSLNCNQSSGYPDGTVQANAENPAHSFTYLANTVFHSSGRVSAFLVDPIRSTPVPAGNHAINGYRTLNPHPTSQSWNISYPCFTTAGGHRVELKDGLWTGSSYDANRLKLINMPVLKTHGGCGVTGALKLFYGVVSMTYASGGYHYGDIGKVLGQMMAHVRAPDLNIMDCIWVCQGQLGGYPASATSRRNTLLASLDPVALDYWAGKNILYPINNDPNHNPDDPSLYTDSNFSQYLDQASAEINSSGGLRGQLVTRQNSAIAVHYA
jgi:uncharacterized protein (DUF362 family)